MTYITTKKVADFLGVSERAIQKRAAKEGWLYREVKNNRYGRGEKEFKIEDLPIGVKNRVLQALASDYQKNVILPPQRADLSLSQATSLIQQWNDAPSWKRREAEARFEILTAFNKFPKKAGREQATDRFVNDFNSHNINLDISTEVYGVIKKISRATFYNYQKAYGKYGLVGLLPKGKGKPRGVWTADFERYMKGLLGKNPDMRAIRIWDFIKNKFGGPGVTIPSKKTVRTRVEKWKKENKSAYTFHRNPDQWRSEFQLALGDASEKAKYFLHIVEFDSSPADVLCRDGIRNTILGAIDIFGRKAKVLVAPTSKAIAVKNLMRSILIDWGLFDVMIVDRGREYVSFDVRVVCDVLGIRLEPTLAFSPELKAFIERFFRSLSMGLFEELSGYIGHNQAQRKAIESRKSFAQRFMQKGELIEIGLTSPELQAVCDTWTENIYHQRVHRSLGKSPEAKTAESARPVHKIADPRLLDILLAPVGYPIVQKKGIRYKNAFYIAPELGDFVKEKVEIRADFQDAGRIYVFENQSHKFICIAEDASISGLTVDEINEARNAQKKKVREEARALKALAQQVGDPMAELLESKRTEHGQIKAFHRTEKARSPMIEEAQKAIKAQDQKFEEFKPDTEELKAIEQPKNELKVVPIHDDPPLFDSMLERYKYLIKQRNIRKLTQREEGFVEGYKASEEYYRIFVMPYEGGQGL